MQCWNILREQLMRWMDEACNCNRNVRGRQDIALKMLEDLGFYCVDNLPISLVDKFAQLAAAGSDINQAALGIDIRSGEELNQLDAILGDGRNWGMDYQILFLDAK